MAYVGDYRKIEANSQRITWKIPCIHIVQNLGTQTAIDWRRKQPTVLIANKGFHRVLSKHNISSQFINILHVAMFLLVHCSSSNLWMFSCENEKTLL